MANSPFNLVTAAAILQRQWKAIAGMVLVILAAAAITLFCVPQYFRSKTIVVPANPVLADKARLFNANIQTLYSYFGTGDDLDRMYGIADMDTTYQQLVTEFALIDYYQLTGDSLAVLKRKAVLKLRSDMQVHRTEKDQLEIIAWTKNKQLAADLVNRMVSIIQQRQLSVWEQNYQRSLTTLDSSIKKMKVEYKELNDSFTVSRAYGNSLTSLRLQTLLTEINQYQRAGDEFKLAISTHPDVLYVMETGMPAARPERPDKPAILLAALVFGTVFSCLVVLVTNRKIIA